MTAWALRLSSRKDPTGRLLPRRFDTWQHAARVARSVSNDPWWKQSGDGHICGPYGDDFIVWVRGGFLRVVRV